MNTLLLLALAGGFIGMVGLLALLVPRTAPPTVVYVQPPIERGSSMGCLLLVIPVGILFFLFMVSSLAAPITP